MKRRYLVCCVLSASCLSLPAFADSTAATTDLPAPDMGQYVAYAPPQKSRIAEFFSNVYISGKIGAAFMQIKNINTDTPQLVQNTPSATPQQTSQQQNELNKGIAIGYNLPPMENTLFNRIEIEYMSRSNLDYNTSPIVAGGNFNTTSLNSTIDNQTLFAKWYGEFKFGHFPVRPFVVGGVGLSHNVIKSNSYFIDSSQINPGLNGNTTVKENNLGWTLGAGVAYYFNKHVAVDADYEFVSLGDLEWDIPTNLGYTAMLQSNRFYANTVNAALRIIL